MSDSLRERILLALIHSTPNEYLPPPNAMSTQVDAVIAALPELTEPVSVEAIGDYQYVCHPCGSRPRVASLGRLWELADAVDDLREALDQPLNRWLRGDNRRISALLDGRFDELVDLAVNRAPFPRREIGTSVYEGVAEYVQTPIIRSGGPLVTEDVEDGFAMMHSGSHNPKDADV